LSNYVIIIVAADSQLSLCLLQLSVVYTSQGHPISLSCLGRLRVLSTSTAHRGNGALAVL